MVGLALDKEDEPDSIYYLNSGKRFVVQAADMVKRTVDIFLLAFKCAAQHDLKRIYLCRFGCGNRGSAGDTWYVETVFLPALQTAIQSAYLEDASVHFLIHESDHERKAIEKRLETTNINVLLAKNDLAPLFDNLKEDLPDCLFLNAWNPHTVVGLGNGEMDRWFGAHTAISLLSFPRINEEISYTSLREGDLDAEANADEEEEDDAFSWQDHVQMPQFYDEPMEHLIDAGVDLQRAHSLVSELRFKKGFDSLNPYERNNRFRIYANNVVLNDTVEPIWDLRFLYPVRKEQTSNKPGKRKQGPGAEGSSSHAGGSGARDEGGGSDVDFVPSEDDLDVAELERGIRELEKNITRS